MLKRIASIGIALLFLLSNLAFAAPGKLFNVSASGPAGNVQVTLCLNGLGVLSCQQYSLSSLHLKITPVARDHVYPSIGITINTPGYSFARLGLDCTLNSNGYCIFTASSVAPAVVNLKQTSSPAVTLTATPSTLTIAGENYSQANTASAGTQPYTFSMAAGALPAGTSLNPTTGTVSGTPNTGGPFTYTIQVTDANFETATAVTSGTIAGGVVLTSTASPATELGIAYSQTNVGSGGQTPYVYSVTAGSVPAGTTLDTASGTVAGTPTTAGSFSYAITVTDANSGVATNTITGTIATTVSLAAVPSTNKEVGISYSQANVASGGTSPYAFNLFSGALPLGTTLNATTGTVAGTPTTVGNFNYVIQVTDNSGATATATSTGSISFNPWSVNAIDGGHHLSAVSCPSSTTCLAVDQSGLGFIYNGFSWTSSPVPSGFLYTSISCPTSTFCIATGNTGSTGAVFQYNGSSWSGADAIDGSNDLVSVSCPSASFCMAVDGVGNAFTFDGTNWNTTTASHLTLTAVSCLSGTFCMAVDSSGNAASFNGSAWQTYASVSSIQLTSVSCTQNSGSFCVAVNAQGQAYKFTAGTWDAGTSIDSPNTLSGVSCLGTAFCMAVDGVGNALGYNGSTWAAPADVDGTSSITAISCPSATFCAAVDNVGNALLFKPQAVNVVAANAGTGTFATPGVFTFGIASSGNVAGTYQLTQLSKPEGAFIDTNNNLWVADNGAATIYRFSASATGSATGLASVSLANTSSTLPSDVVTDSSGNIYVVDQGNAIYVYDNTFQEPGTYANATPASTITGVGTGLNMPQAIAVDSGGNIWVVNKGANSIEKFTAGSTGNATPAVTISGSNTTLAEPSGIYIDAAGNIWVTNFTGNTIAVFAPGAANNAIPTCVISSTSITNPTGIVLDTLGNIYQANSVSAGGAINIFATVSPTCVTTTISPNSFITGANTKLDTVFGLALGYTF